MALVGIVKLYKHRNFMLMKSDQCPLVFGFNIVLLLAMISSTFGNACIFHFHGTAMIIVSMSIWYTCWWLLLYFLTVKEWMVFYKYKWSFYTLQLKWQSILNSQIGDNIKQQNWFIRNNHKYGNLKNVYKIFALIYSFAFIVSAASVVRISHPNASEQVKLYGAGIQFILVVPAILFYFILVCNTPYIQDTFYIHWESRIHSRILFIMGFFSILANIISIVTQSEFWVAITGGPMLVAGFFAVNNVSTFSVISKNKNSQKSLGFKENGEQDIHGNTKSSDHITLEVILTDKTTINLFMHHLSREYVLNCYI